MADKLDPILGRGRPKRRLPPPEVRKALRVGAGLTQDDTSDAVAALTGYRVSRPTISRWETGKRDPRGETLIAYLQVLDRIAAEVDPRA
jgi:transcriptional regulator with XRE-family HTH domain